jgi:SAM-dependent methyltransferase
MKETTKAAEIRKARGEFERYLTGNGIDIGAGDDPLVILEGTVRAYDQKDGDAQLMAGVPDASYDFVYSSHCLEHMRDVRMALRNWVRILKPGGILYVVVPDFEIYEKSSWPSRFNQDHKASFSINRLAVKGHIHYWMHDLVDFLDTGLGVSTLELRLEDYGFDRARFEEDQTLKEKGWAQEQICLIGYKRK